MSNAWDHLPNARHIDRVLAALKQHPEDWLEIEDNPEWDALRAAAMVVADKVSYDMGLTSLWNEIWDTAWDSEWQSSRDEYRDEAWDTAWDSITALIAHDRAGSYFSLSPDKVKMLSLLGDNVAVLMYPAVLIFSRETENA